MLNKSGITTISGVAPRQILANVEHQYSVGILVSNESSTVDEDGKKIVKAGTPLTGDLTSRTTPFTNGTTDTVGILLHDVDVTNGNANGTLLLFGFVDLNKIDTTTAALITDSVKTATNMIKFIK